MIQFCMHVITNHCWVAVLGKFCRFCISLLEDTKANIDLLLELWKEREKEAYGRESMRLRQRLLGWKPNRTTSPGLSQPRDHSHTARVLIGCVMC